MNRRSLRRLLLILSVATVAILGWNQFGMNERRVIDGSTGLQVVTRDDRANHGASVATLERRARALTLGCDVRTVYRYPFCILSLRLGSVPEGVDLSGFDRLRVWVKAEGPEARKQVRFALRNYNPGYSRLDEEESLKNQEVIYSLDTGSPLEVRLAQFGVASWWAEEHQLPLAYAGLEFDHVVAIDITTASELQPGPHRITVERIELEGKWIAPARLRLLVIAAWLAATFVFLGLEAVATRRELARTRHSQATLQQINDALRTESATYASIARRDPLTGLLNRQGLGDALQELSRRTENLFPLSLVFVDIDHFKRVNDDHGHAVGDEVIRETAACIVEHVERGDILDCAGPEERPDRRGARATSAGGVGALVTRWGGEEFLLVCPRMPVQEAALMAERLRMMMTAHRWPRDLQVSCSFGVAGAGSAPRLREGIDRADHAMYLAKRSGRNRVCLDAHGEDAGPYHAAAPASRAGAQAEMA
jgi:GGDEF domain-containing protein